LMVSLTIVCAAGISLETICLDGNINYDENVVQIMFDIWQPLTPNSLESNDKDFIEYAKNHDREQVKCDVIYIQVGHMLYWKLGKVYF